MENLALKIAIATSLAFTHTLAQATTVWGQGFYSDFKPVELILSLDHRNQLLLYGLGPTLQELGVRNRVIPKPTIRLFRIDENGQRILIDSNDNWRQHPSVNAVSSAQDDLGIELNNNEAAMVKQLNPGRYVLVVANAVAGRQGYTAAGATTWKGDFNPGPPDSGGTDIASGLWVGQSGSDYDLCFNVSGDGSVLTQNSSECRSAFGDREALFLGFIRVEGACDEYVDNFDWDQNIPIVNNKFRLEFDVENLPVLPPISVLIEGTFDDGVLSGTVTERIGSTSCSGDFIARPQ
jgi:hypothetical protein